MLTYADACVGIRCFAHASDNAVLVIYILSFLVFRHRVWPLATFL
jgi:hypothetical protein